VSIALKSRVILITVLLAAFSLVIPAAVRLHADETAKPSDEAKSSQLALKQA
jgi:hypothetical protein